MTQVLTFSQLVDRSYKAMLPLLKTYILGALTLLIISFVFRGIGGGIFVLIEHPAFKDNTMIVIAAVIIGVVFMVVGSVFQILQTMYALVLAVDRTKNVKAGIRKTGHMLIKLLLGGVWMLLRSFGWIAVFGLPFLAFGANGNNTGVALLGIVPIIAGVLCFIYFMPRLLFVNVIQLCEGMSVRKSADASYARTAGYWGKIVGNTILMMLCVGLLTTAVVAVAALIFFAMMFLSDAIGLVPAMIVGIPVRIAAVIAVIIFFFGLSLFAQVYYVELHDTIKAHPKITKA